MKTLIVCATAAEAKLLQHTFFKEVVGGEDETVCVGAGTALTGWHFHRIIYMPGWNRVIEEPGRWKRDVIGTRVADPHFHMELFL